VHHCAFYKVEGASQAADTGVHLNMASMHKTKRWHQQCLHGTLLCLIGSLIKRAAAVNVRTANRNK
jgi:hypothetical protein